MAKCDTMMQEQSRMANINLIIQTLQGFLNDNYIRTQKTGQDSTEHNIRLNAMIQKQKRELEIGGAQTRIEGTRM